MNRKRLVLSFLFLLAMQFMLHSQVPKENALLWKITGPSNPSQSSYLFGTFHLLCASDFSLPDTLISLLHQCRQVYFELKLDDPSMTTSMMQSITMKNGQKLNDLLPPATFDSAAKIFQQKTNIPISFVASYKPFVLSSMLYPAMLGCVPISVEMEILNKAKKDSVSVMGLEKVEDQMSVFDSIPYTVQAKQWAKSLLGFDQSVADMKKMISTYKSKNIDAIQKEVETDTEFSAYENVLLRKRNAKWVPLLKIAMDTKPTFIAVGAGHLGGEYGVINLLRKQGYTVTPVMYK
ncbi:MAG: TraB/GumN family protein [Bacteroidota bacterium]|nr:TraB/GumN family protein [Bacteroidota bacterium]